MIDCIHTLFFHSFFLHAFFLFKSSHLNRHCHPSIHVSSNDDSSYGIVYKARNKKTNQILALKIVPVENDISEVEKEIAILKQCDNPNIVSYHGSYNKGNELWVWHHPLCFFFTQKAFFALFALVLTLLFFWCLLHLIFF